MKQLKSVLTILVLSAFMVGNLQAKELEKKYHKSYPKSEVMNLMVDNKFGNIVVGDYGGNEVTIDVKITVVSGNEQKAKRVLDGITVSFSHSGKDLMAETHFSENNRNVSFQIDYKINIPKDRNLDIENKYGDVVVDELTGEGRFVVGYGALRGSNWTFPKGKHGDISVAYGRLDVDYISDAHIEIRYSKYYGDEGGTLDIDTRYSEVEVEKVDVVRIDSRYDKFRFEKVNHLEGEAAYTGFKLEECASYLVLANSYGNLRVGYIPPSFEKVDVSISYGKIHLGFDENASYNLDADVSYSSFDYPPSDRVNRSRSSNRTILKGVIGRKADPNPWVKIRNKYGGVSLENN